VWQRAITTVSNVVPFALFDVLLIATVIVFAIAIVRCFRQPRRGSAFVRLAAAIIVVAAATYLVFLFSWGLNYRRVPLIERVAFDRGRITREAATALMEQAATQLNLLYAEAHAREEPLDALAAAFGAAQRSLGTPRSIVFGRPKDTLLGEYFHQTAVTGMTDPFFLETLVAPDLLPVERPFVIAHEWAHLAGYADESEANFVGFLATMHGDAAARYSGWLMVIEYVRPDPRRLRQALAIGPRSDLDAIALRYQATSPVLRAAARESYDTYLKANRVRAGVVSYDLVVQLILGTTFEQDWKPRLR
jgi:hypothetical protein